MKAEKLNNETIQAKFAEFAKALFEIADDLIFIIDTDGRIAQINSLGAIALDYSSEELIGKSIYELVDSDDTLGFMTEIKTILTTKHSASFLVKLLSKLNKQIAYQIELKPVFNVKEIIGLVCVGKNLSLKLKYENSIIDYKNKLIEAERLLDLERSRSNYKLQILDELNELKSKFISNISHELRTPLASIIGFSESMLEDPNLSEEIKAEFNNIILQEGKRLAKLLTEVLDISKLESGNLLLNNSIFDLVTVVKDVFNVNKESVPEGVLNFNVQLPEYEINFYGDKDRIAQCFNGVIDNAVKYTNKGGLITVIAKESHNNFILIVSDTGVGIADDEIPYIFNEFYKAGASPENKQGAGLELALVKKIINLHKGIIQVRSEYGKGSTFTIELPKLK